MPVGLTPAIVDLSDRAKLQLQGPDRVRYLNGQVTNNVANYCLARRVTLWSVYAQRED